MYSTQACFQQPGGLNNAAYTTNHVTLQISHNSKLACSTARKMNTEATLQLISASRSMFQTSAQHAFAISVNCDTSGAHCQQCLLQHSCTLSWRPG